MEEQVPLVSVWMTTYNHEKYIAQAIESVVRQKTGFPFELLIGEDCSTDNTASICKNLAEKYPNIIRLFSREVNYGMMKNGYETLRQARGKYIAILEGDDYWLNENKLQLQVDFLEANPDFVLCSGYANACYGVADVVPVDPLKVVSKTIPFKEMLIQNSISTLTVLFRNVYDYNHLETIIAGSKIGDWPMYVYVGLQQGGKYYIMPQVFGVYREHAGGVYSSLSRKKGFINIFHTLGFINTLTQKKYSYLFLISTLVYLDQQDVKPNKKEALLAEVAGSGIEESLKEALLQYVKAERNEPDKILKQGINSNDCLAVSGFLMAQAYILSGKNFASFSGRLNKIAGAVSGLQCKDEALISDFISTRWFSLYVFFNYSLSDVLLMYFNKHLFKSKVSFKDWLYTNRETFPVLARLSSLSKKLS